MPESRASDIRLKILELVREYYEAAFPEAEFAPGESPVPYAGRVFDDREIVNLVDSGLDFWLTTGRFADEFEKSFAKFFGRRHAHLVNSGSSANLLALSTLTSPKLDERARKWGGRASLKPGDEVITVAAGFPTTLNPIIQNRMVPVFVDITVPTYNIDVSRLEDALSERTAAIMVAHTLGNPFDLDAVTAFAERHHLWLVEDCCDALGSTYRGRQVGTFGDLATVSFYPAHHMTMGEGGCVLEDRGLLKMLVDSYRDWGRDCWCDPGKSNTCGKRFGWEVGELPFGYDHKYTYSHIGYNLKVTDMQAAIGGAQLEKLDGFIAARRANYDLLMEALRPYVRSCPAETLRSLPDTATIDLAFLDADKRGYRDYAEQLIRRLRPGGVLLVDNVLWHGTVLDADTDADSDAAHIRAFNEWLAANQEVDSVMLPIADGVTLSRKR